LKAKGVVVSMTQFFVQSVMHFKNKVNFIVNPVPKDTSKLTKFIEHASAPIIPYKPTYYGKL